ncbi:uncharacterized protein [Mycetomoellerius zeteki]|uniref:uncharacterized protein isoform X1 n=2 Tax=Mycetomoellerius zeteki TaxID=64791 RepID=UPI00084E9079|nr:PREDICTED: uncharacterized protein LOC108728661 isoform X1 [Trachymyrmex zeteki]XP_018312874.1 PREDICTED: uncharacterized protein LOC108728661 isoform X1 [Trachymyrmex zeteki]XP_018312875.1 PREDICTED: uncharacterized protein LOC108728661 isoform X1 [Trachymyrmex zeteki]XP_018312876.1 PREDICTED: uncharacterized protein LOC108728661 isoform X1 [Trachymyrmex zeteki]XP_018312878.1 PREDICTED: uncharacterized protein LOC108728661 isoform X1 [Trachymyrmex zeteki]XP_018312879.1 PREDICTED: uncharact
MDNERVDYKAAKADGRVTNNHRKGLNYHHLVQKHSDNENRMQKRKEFSSEATEDETEEEEREIDEDRSEEEDAKIQKVDTNQEEANENEQETAQIEQCAICHVIINDANLGGTVANSEQNPHCSEGYLLCRRCVQNFSIRSVAEHPQPRRSHTSFFQGRDSDRNIRPRTYDPHRNQWTCNFNKAVFGEGNKETLDYESDTISYVADRDRGNLRREEQVESCRKQYQQQHGYCNLMTTTTRRNGAVDRYPSEIKVKSPSLVDCSRRPIHCPRLDCSVNVAFSALTHHFLFDHPEVPILSVEPGAESTLIVSYGALSCNSSRCLALLLVSGKLSDSSARLFGSIQINPKYRNRLPLPVLAARLHSSHNYTCREEMHAGGEGQCEKDMIIAWVAGLDVGDTTDRLRCSIQAVDSIENGGFRSLTYTGPVTSLRVAQCPRDVFLAGDCIVLHEGLISHITSGCTSLNVNVIVH